MDEGNKIFVDTDFLSCFLWTKKGSLILRMFPDYKIMIPYSVQQEIKKRLPGLAPLQMQYRLAVGNGEIIECDMLDTESEEYQLFLLLISRGYCGGKLIGKGEAACIVLAKKYKGILASNNLRDVREYVEKFELSHLTTCDIMLKAYKEHYEVESDLEILWQNMINYKNKMPYKTFHEFLLAKGEKQNA